MVFDPWGTDLQATITRLIERIDVALFRRLEKNQNVPPLRYIYPPRELKIEDVDDGEGEGHSKTVHATSVMYKRIQGKFVFNYFSRLLQADAVDEFYEDLKKNHLLRRKSKQVPLETSVRNKRGRIRTTIKRETTPEFVMSVNRFSTIVCGFRGISV